MGKDYSSTTMHYEKQIFMKDFVLAWKESGISKSAYCRKNNLSTSVFGYWRRKLNISCLGGVGNYITDFLSESEPTEIDFLSLSTSDEPLEKINANKLLCVELPNGIKITFY